MNDVSYSDSMLLQSMVDLFEEIDDLKSMLFDLHKRIEQAELKKQNLEAELYRLDRAARSRHLLPQRSETLVFRNLHTFTSVNGQTVISRIQLWRGPGQEPYEPIPGSGGDSFPSALSAQRLFRPDGNPLPEEGLSDVSDY